MQLTLRELRTLIKESSTPSWVSKLPPNKKETWARFFELVRLYTTLREETPKIHYVKSDRDEKMAFGDSHKDMVFQALAQSDSYEEFIKEFEKINYRFKSDIRRESPEWSIAGFIDFFNQIIEFAREEKKKYLHVPRQTEISPEEEEKAKLGKFALPQIRNDLPRSVTKLDPNTSYENELEQDIETHVRSTSNPIDKKHVDYIRDALKHGWYPNIFKAPNVDVVYRGIVVRYATAERLFGITQEQVEDLKNDGQPFDIEINKTVKSSNNEDKAVSWSKQLRVAEGFSWSGFSEQAVGIIFHAHVADNPGLFWDLSASTKYDTEDEVIALSNLIKIFKITVK